MKKVLFALAAISFMFMVAQPHIAKANPLLSKGLEANTQSSVQLAGKGIKKKIKKLFKKKKNKKAVRRTRYKSCGEFKYRDKKTKKCVDARA